ncbi:tRNA(Met) cytidine acetyltransferase [Halonotius aquaticus]|uniref:tRNA(Met) cytidine acetyltransferase TmcA n=1 Tax=Halonotius aquaticus TaxID=2216978 RepID=A0A3A6PU87_9EURY|nr:tRNA(Met) cytidine acetyltransferase TmcA [Halonotius aquaticus]RJX45184.1 tRNA(Met) cytidine acetyltransferase [Halonotius aquaticus]
MDLRGLVASLRENAHAANERRLLALTGDREAGIDAAYTAIAAAGVDDEAVSLVTTQQGFRYHRLHPDHADELLGTTREIVVLDCHEGFSANALGQVTGAVDGGGLLVLVLPPLGAIPNQLIALVDQVAVPPFSRDDVGNHFRRRLVTTLRHHPGVAIVRLPPSTAATNDDTPDEITIKRDGLINRSQSTPPSDPRKYTDTPFPDAAYEACRTVDQARGVAGLSALSSPGNAVVVEADRGRGKSSAAGLAAAALAADGRDVLVTAPSFDNAAELFERATELLATLDHLAADGSADSDTDKIEPPMATTAGGRIRFASPPDAADLPSEPDVVIVDEAAALPVRLLERLLDAPAVGFCTTVHGYEGSGRGFAVRFRDRLAASSYDVTDIELREPIRYGQGDPIEAWLAWTLLLDAEPPADQLVADATPETVSYRTLTADDLVDDESLFRSVVGLLVAAHYKTEPDDIVRLLDAPNLKLRALLADGHPVSVALLAREGGLSSEQQAEIYRGQRVQGNMLPDVLTSQLRDPTAAGPVGYRVMRIATHHAARSRGLGSELLSWCHDEFGDAVDWFGVGFGATPRLLSFWRVNGYRPVHLSVTRNQTSGEHSALMLRPCSTAGIDLAGRHSRWFRERIAGQLADTLSGVAPDVIRGVLRAVSVPADDTQQGTLDLDDRGWRVLAGVAYGPGTYEAAPHVFQQLAMAHLISPIAELSPRAERLLVRKVLQCAPWATVADELGFASERQCKRAFGTIVRQFCEAVDDEAGGDIIAEERATYED